MTFVLDVNALLAIADESHVFHELIHKWFRVKRGSKWATCPLTENGFVRILSQPNYRGGPFSAGEAIDTLRAMKEGIVQEHVFWPDSVSVTDENTIRGGRVAGPKQVTDVYLVALALRQGGRLVSFDQRVAWQAVEGATAELVVTPQT